jgi:hypothetical protein
MNTMHLVGADQVLQAGHQIAAAAQSMNQCAATIQASSNQLCAATVDLERALLRHQAFMTAWIERAEKFFDVRS